MRSVPLILTILVIADILSACGSDLSDENGTWYSSLALSGGKTGSSPTAPVICDQASDANNAASTGCCPSPFMASIPVSVYNNDVYTVTSGSPAPNNKPTGEVFSFSLSDATNNLSLFGTTPTPPFTATLARQITYNYVSHEMSVTDTYAATLASGQVTIICDYSGTLAKVEK